MSTEEHDLHYRIVISGWVLKYKGGMYADIGHVDAGCKAVHCFNYGDRDERKLDPVTKERLHADLKEWVEEEGDTFYKNMVYYL